MSLECKLLFHLPPNKEGPCEGSVLPFTSNLADFFTKLLQGAFFVCMHENILNLPISASANIHRSVLEDKKITTKML